MEGELEANDSVDYEAGREDEMSARALKTAVLSSLLSTSLLCAADFSNYRGFVFGADVAAVAKQAGRKATDVTLVQQRPAMIQELDWEPRYAFISDPLKADPIKDGVLCFFDGKLYRIVITYDRYRVEGMTADDLVAAISRTYGTAARPKAEIAYHSNYSEVAKVVARWENAEYSYDLIRTGDESSFALILYSKERDAMAQTSIVEAKRLDILDEPQRVIDEQKKRAEADRLSLEKTRATNMPNFRP